MPENKIVIFDFDGTLTQAQEEARPFLTGYKEDIAELLGKADINEEWEEAKRVVLQSPGRYGWKDKGLVIASPNTDEYVLARSIAQFLLSQRRILENSRERENFLQKVFRRHYQKSATIFKPEAREVLETLVDQRPLTIVTNARPDAVARKMARLNPRGKEKIRIFGDAQKYVLDSGFDAVPETMEIAGLDRKIYLRRRKYFDVLNAIWQEYHVAPEQTLIVGDSFELDLVLPATLGCRIFLVADERTPNYEKEAVRDMFHGQVSEDLNDILKII